MRLGKRLCCLLALVELGATALPVRAQATRAMVLTLPASTRAAAMGDAFGLSAVDSDAVFYNAAFNDRLRGAGLSFASYGGHTSYYTMSAGTDWLGGAIGLGVQALDYHHAGAAPVLFGGGGASQCCGPAKELVLLLVYGRRVKGLRLALTGKYFEHRIYDENRRIFLGDVATSFTYRAVSVGAAVQNLGPPVYDFLASDVNVPGSDVLHEAVKVPVRGVLNVGTARSFPIGPLDIAASGVVFYTREREVLPGGGVELSYYPITGRTFFARAGLRRQAESYMQPYTLGGGFAGDKIVLDYALESTKGFGSVHRFGVKWR